MIEMQKLREAASVPEQTAVEGRLTISDMKLPLKSDFMSKIGSVHGSLAASGHLEFSSSSELFLIQAGPAAEVLWSKHWLAPTA